MSDRGRATVIADAWVTWRSKRTRRGARPLGRLTTEPVASDLVWNDTSESRCSHVAACSQVSARRLNGMGASSLMKAEGCTKETNP
jgi:hypothetical protein